MPKVFVSFVHEDLEIATPTQALLKIALGIDDIFMSSDRAQVFAGDNWLRKIEDSLRDAQVIVLMLSNRSVSRPWVNFEAGAAWLTQKPIVPCCYGRMTKTMLPHPYSALQGLNLKDDRITCSIVSRIT
jgi:hypothetical protein